MSYSILSQCPMCEKQEKCTDAKDIQKGIDIVHTKSQDEGHLGGGNVIIHCFNQKTITPD